MTSDVLNPADVEAAIRELVEQIAHGVSEVSRRHKDKLDRDRIYDHAFAVAYLAHDGPQTEKRYAAEKATQQERLERDVADVAFGHTQRQMKALEGKLSAYQTIAKSIVSMYGAVQGRGN